MAIKLSTLRNPKLRRIIDLITLFVASSLPVDIPYRSVATINLRLRSIFSARASNSGIPHFRAHLSHLPSARQAFRKVSCLKTKRSRSLHKYAAYNSGLSFAKYSSCACWLAVRFSGFFSRANRFFWCPAQHVCEHCRERQSPTRQHETGLHTSRHWGNTPQPAA